VNRLLARGARIAVIAPAGRFSRVRLDAGATVLREMGYEPVFGARIGAVERYHAGTIDDRLADLVWACTAPDIDAIWLARGGFGCAHLLPRLPWQSLRARPLFGFSDATALHVGFWLAGWTTVDGGALIHGPVLQTLAPAPPEGIAAPVAIDQASRTALRDLLRGFLPALPGRLLCGPPAAVEGPLIGGNLTVLASLCGTRWRLRANGCVLLIEDIGEAPYRIDRCITQLVQAGALDGVRGVALGEFIDSVGRDPDGSEYGPLDVLKDRLQPLGVPVVCDLPVGHGVRNVPWHFGRRCRLDAHGVSWH